MVRDCSRCADRRDPSCGPVAASFSDCVKARCRESIVAFDDYDAIDWFTTGTQLYFECHRPPFTAVVVHESLEQIPCHPPRELYSVL